MNLLMLALMVVPAVDGGAGRDAGDNTLGEIRRLSGPLEAAVTSQWVKAWVHAAKGLKPAAPRTYYCGDYCELTPFDGGTRREVNDEL